MVSVGRPDGGDEVSFRPEAVGTPVVFLEDGKLLFDLARGVGLDEANHASDRHLWRDGDQEMHVVLVVVRLLEVQLGVVRREFEQFPVEVLPERVVDRGMPVFGRKHDVVVAEVDAVIVLAVLLWC